MSIELLPRLDRLGVERILETLRVSGNNIESLGETVKSMPDAVKYGAVGGSRLPSERLTDLEKELTSIAKSLIDEHGNNARARSEFDRRATISLAQFPPLQTAEALRDDVWAFLATWRFLALTGWRFGFKSSERFHGGVRNTFQRLWMRANAFDRGIEADDRWNLLDQLSEDAFVQILERPSIGGNSRLALQIGEAWSRGSAKYGRGAMEPIMRKAMIGIRLRNQIIDMSILDQIELAELLDDEFDRAARKLVH